MGVQGTRLRLIIGVLIIATAFMIAALLLSSLTDTGSEPFTPPSSTHILGTDQFGRDVLIRLLLGTRRTLVGAGIATIIALTIGIGVGGLSGGFGGWVDEVLMRGVDVLLAIPGVLLAMALVAGFGTGVLSASIGVGVGLVPGIARLTRTAVRSVKSAPYIEAAQLLGASSLRVVVKHLIPNVVPQVIPFAGVLFAWSVLSISGLEYLGLGGSPSEPSWGRMIAEGRNYLRDAPWIAIAPGIAIILTTLTVIGFSNLVYWSP
jgi:peptide/nickel transport system permease protein